MTNKCAIRSCKSGSKYKANNKHLTLFRAPRSESDKKLWQKAIPYNYIKVTNTTHLCEEHFAEKDIINTWTSGTGENQVVINLQRSRLKKGAIPSIFPDVIPSIFPEKLPSNASDDDDLEEHELAEQERDTFEKFLADPSIISMANNWKYLLSDNAVSFFTMLPRISEFQAPVIEKEVYLCKTNEKLEIKCFLLNHFFDSEYLGVEEEFDDGKEAIENFIKVLDKMKICVGGPLAQKNSGTEQQIEINGKLRHESCPFFLDSSETTNVCEFCLRLCKNIKLKKYVNSSKPELKGLRKRKIRR